MTEINRKIAYKRIAPPGSTPSADGSGSGEIKVPVITEITFRDPVDRGQEATYTVNNAGKAWRDIHVAWVGDKDSADATETPDLGNPCPDDCIAVERLEKWRVKDSVDRGQQTQPQFDNKTFDSNGPPFFTTHKKTHIVRYINEPDDGSFVESELIDQINFKDSVERGQQTHYTLQNPPDNTNIGGLIIDSTTDDNGNPITTVAIDPNGSLSDVTEPSDSNNPVDQGTNDAPYRLDPFQNVVRVADLTDLLITFRQAFGASIFLADGFKGTAYGFTGKDFTKLPDVPVPDNVTITTPIFGFFRWAGEPPPAPQYLILTIPNDQSQWNIGWHVSTVLNYESGAAFEVDRQKAATGQGGPIAAYCMTQRDSDPSAVLEVHFNQVDTFLSANDRLGYGHNVWLSTGQEVKVQDNKNFGYARTRIYKSTDGAQTWQETYLGDGEPTGIGYVKVKSNDPNIPDNSVYVGCNNKTLENNLSDPPTFKLLISSDGSGAIWGPSSQSGFVVADIFNVDAVNGALFATGFAIVRSEDGVSWQDVTPSGYAPVDFGPLGGVAYGSRLNKDDPENPKPRYATVTNVLSSFISDDGISWKAGGSLPAPPNSPRGLGTVSGIAASGDVVVAAYSPDVSPSGRLCIARSDDGCLNWSLVDLPISGSNDYGIVAGVRYSHGKFVAGGSAANSQTGTQTGCIWTSGDGSKWKLEVQIENGGFQILCVGMALGRIKKPPP